LARNGHLSLAGLEPRLLGAPIRFTEIPTLELSSPMIKICNKCRQALPLAQFSRSSGRKSGVRAECKKCVARYRRENNAERVEYNRRWQAANPGRYPAYLTEYRRRNLDRLQAAERQYAKTERGKITRTAAEHKRRARKRGESAPTTEEITRILAARSCHLCGRRFTAKRPATLDHVIPLAKGGKHEVSNLAAAHGSCNNRKRANLINPATNQGILI
jgi:5-methylcytosine-specific restriction endonuclease McrA